MGGLMMAMYVHPPEGYVINEPKRREMRVFVHSDSVPALEEDDGRLRFFGPSRRRFAYVLQEGPDEPEPDSLRLPGSPLILWKGEPTAIQVINRTPEPTQIHLNGSKEPPPAEMRVGEAYRLRLMNITLASPGLRVLVTRNGAPVRWRPLAKDGADLPGQQRTLQTASQPLSIGETLDVEVRPPRGAETLVFEVRSGGGRLLVSQEINVIPAEVAPEGNP